MERATICINTSDRPLALLVVLNSLLIQTVNCFDVVVVDDGSTTCIQPDQIEILTRHFSSIGVKFSVKKNPLKLGLAKSRNVGIDMMSTDIGVFLDDDHICDSRFVELLLSTFEKRNNVGCVGALFPHIEGQIKYVNNNPPNVFGDLLNDAGWGDHQRWYFPFMSNEDGIYPAIALGGIVAFRIDPHIRKDERLSFVSHTEDTLFALRYIEEGYKNYVNIRALAYHRLMGDGGCRTFPDADDQRGRDSAVFHGEMERIAPLLRTLSF